MYPLCDTLEHCVEHLQQCIHSSAFNGSTVTVYSNVEDGAHSLCVCWVLCCEMVRVRMVRVRMVRLRMLRVRMLRVRMVRVRVEGKRSMVVHMVCSIVGTVWSCVYCVLHSLMQCIPPTSLPPLHNTPPAHHHAPASTILHVVQNDRL